MSFSSKTSACVSKIAMAIIVVVYIGVLIYAAVYAKNGDNSPKYKVECRDGVVYYNDTYHLSPKFGTDGKIVLCNT